MKDIYLVNYSVKGIKTLDQLITLSFYKKTISNDFDTQEYNMKGIYGINGSGKSAIITSADILKNLLINPGYLNNPIVQKNLDEIVNKRSGELFIEAEFVSKLGDKLVFFQYKVLLSREKSGKYTITYEKLSSKKATSKSNLMETIFEVKNGDIVSVTVNREESFYAILLKKTTNLLSTTTMSALFYEKISSDISHYDLKRNADFAMGVMTLFIFGCNIHVYLDKSDVHKDYLLQNSSGYMENFDRDDSNIDNLLEHFLMMNGDHLRTLSESANIIAKENYGSFEKNIGRLCKFLQIFKSDLQKIEIDKKEDHEFYVCNLIMVYDSYKIYAEFESTGIKKLIRLFAYLKEMDQGGIVFIDEFDSNLHDVYLCALLEYLMEYGKGQLCFTTHNVGPMDVLKRHKKSIDFLSEDHRIYPWTTNGNYSPSKLYRSGMIEGSPFNVDSIDFIGVFSSEKEDE